MQRPNSSLTGVTFQIFPPRFTEVPLACAFQRLISSLLKYLNYLSLSMVKIHFQHHLYFRCSPHFYCFCPLIGICQVAKHIQNTFNCLIINIHTVFPLFVDAVYILFVPSSYNVRGLCPVCACCRMMKVAKQ